MSSAASSVWSQPVRLSFSIPDAYGGLAKTEGIAEVTESGVYLEFEVEDGFIGAFKSGAKEAKLSASQIRSAELRAGWFRTRLILEAKTLGAMGDIPGSKQGRVILKLPRREREAAGRAVSVLEASLAREELEGLSRELDERRSPRAGDD